MRSCYQVHMLHQTCLIVIQDADSPYRMIAMTDATDYDPFIKRGIPSNGIAAGAQQLKTEKQREVFGGIANAPFDPCYHQACDTVNNINLDCLGEMIYLATNSLKQLSEDKNLRKFLGE